MDYTTEIIEIQEYHSIPSDTDPGPEVTGEHHNK